MLQALAEHPEESLAALADRSEVTTHATPQAPRRKRAASLVGAAEPAPALDHLGEPTEAGRLLVAGATAVVERVEEHMLTGMAGRDRDRLAGLLQRCVDNLQKPLPPQQHVSASIR